MLFNRPPSDPLLVSKGSLSSKPMEYSFVVWGHSGGICTYPFSRPKEEIPDLILILKKLAMEMNRSIR